MDKHTQTIQLSVFDHSVGLALKGLNEFTLNHFTIYPKSNLKVCNASPKNSQQELFVSSATLQDQILEERKGDRF